nr:hypothetical protein [uncultured Caldimonas sp.]
MNFTSIFRERLWSPVLPPGILGIRLQTPTLIGCYLLKNNLNRAALALLFSSLTRHQQRSEIMTNFFKPCQALGSFFLRSSLFAAAFLGAPP